MTRQGALRYAAQIDANHTEIVEELEACGWCVMSTNRVGDGFPDLVIAWDLKTTILVEVKDGSKPPSGRKLNPKQEAFRARWKGRHEVIETKEQARALKP